MKLLLITFIYLALVAANYGADQTISPLDGIRENKSITISDGSSFYTFRDDHSFQSGPLQMGGRTITGRWRVSNEHADGRFIVEGTWSWINGLSSLDDFREIQFDVRPGTFRKTTDTEKRFTLSPEIFECYFLIDKLTRISRLPAEQGAAANP